MIKFEEMPNVNDEDKDQETFIKSEIKHESSKEMQFNIFSGESDIDYVKNFAEIKTEVEETVENSASNKVCEFQESEINSINTLTDFKPEFEIDSLTAGDEKPDFVFNIVPVSADELISDNRDIKINDEAHTQVSV